MKRKVFFVSDSTGMTVESLGKSLISQFAGEFTCITKPYINTPERADELIATINAAAENDSERPLLIDTIVDSTISERFEHSEGFRLNVFNAFISPLEQELKQQQNHNVGHAHTEPNTDSYTKRIDAIHYAMENDDGGKLNKYAEADIILVGVSRSGKTRHTPRASSE